jgi:competence protein ComEC
MFAIAHRDGRDKTDLRFLISRRFIPLDEPISFEGCVVEDSFRRGEEDILTLQFHTIFQMDQSRECKGKGILRIPVAGSEDFIGLSAPYMRGDCIKGWAIWHIPRNYRNPGSADNVGQLANRGIYLIGRAKSPRLLEKIPGGCATLWSRVAVFVNARVRSSLEPIRQKTEEQTAAVLSSLLVGDYSGLSNTTREIFQNTGTYHVLVVSGLHVAWISGLLLHVLKLLLLPERVRYLLVALVILGYTCVVGFQASITRCLWMFLLYLIGRMLFRRAEVGNILLSSALILLVARPAWLFDVGFQLSFLSVLAIAGTAAPAIQQYLRPLWEPLWNAGKTDRLFLKPGRWHRLGRALRTRCEVLVEGATDVFPLVSPRILLFITRMIGGAGLSIGSMILTSVSVQLWIEPLLALRFNRLSWISPLANLVMVPLSSIVLAAGVAVTLTAGWPQVGSLCLSLAESSALSLVRIAAFISSLPGAWQRCPTSTTIWIVAGILALFLWSFWGWRRFWIPCAYIGLLLFCLASGSVPVLGTRLEKWRDTFNRQQEERWPDSAPVLRLTFLDVGEGDSIIIRFPNRQTWVIDAGGLRLPPSREANAYAFDVGEAVVSRYLWHEWITRINRLILTHTDQDHAGGMPVMLKNFHVSGFTYSQSSLDPMLASILKTARQKDIGAEMLQAGAEKRVGPVLIRTLHPSPGFKSDSTNENSIVLHISYKAFAALLTGDNEKAGEMELLSRSEGLRSLLLKVAHHGSRFATTHAFLDRVQPRWAVISVGHNNPFGHPSPQVLERLLRHDARSLLTCDEGAISFETDGNQYLIRSYVRGILERGPLK